MTNEKILKKAIEKAVKGGYEPMFPVAAWFQLYPGSQNMFEYKGTLSYKDYYVMIFSHDFAKAFWGKEMVCNVCGDQGCYEISDIFPKGEIEMWKYCLKKMALEKDPVKYLEQFL